MDYSQQKHDRWMDRYKRRSGISYEEYNKIIASNNSLLERINSGHKCVLNRSYDEAIKELSLGINIGEQLLSDDNLIDESELAKAYMNRGVAYEHSRNRPKAIIDKTKSVEMLEKLNRNRHLEDEDILALAYMNRGATYDSMGEYSLAIADGEKSISIWDQMKRERKKVSSDYAKVLANIGIAKRKLNQ